MFFCNQQKLSVIFLLGFNTWSTADTEGKCEKTEERIEENHALYKAEIKQLEKDKETIMKEKADIEKVLISARQ